jgi:hypothetical protein
LESRQLLAHQPAGFAELGFHVKSIVADPIRNLVYAVGDDQKIHIVDTDTARETRQISLSLYPGVAGITPDGAFLIVALEEEQKVEVISLTTYASVRTLNVGHDLVSIAGGVGGKFYGAFEGTFEDSYRSEVVQYDLVTGASVSIAETSSPKNVETNAGGTYLYASNDSFFEFQGIDSVDEFDIRNPSAVTRVRRYTENAQNVPDVYADRSAGRIYRINSIGTVDSVSYYDINTGAQSTLWSAGTIDDFTGATGSLAKLPGAGTLYYCRGDFRGYSTIDVLNVNSGAIQDTYEVSGEIPEHSLVMTPNGRVVYGSLRQYSASSLDPDWNLGIVGAETLTMADSRPALMGVFFEDLDADSLKDANESSFVPISVSPADWDPEVRVYLDLNNNGKWDDSTYPDYIAEPYTEVTGPSTFRLQPELPGTYTLRAEVKTSGTLGYPIFVLPTFSRTITVTAGEQLGNLNIPCVAGFSASGTVFLDFNGNGIKDRTDFAIEESVYFDANNNGSFDANEADAICYPHSDYYGTEGGFDLGAPSANGTLRLKNDHGYRLTTPSSLPIAGTRGAIYSASFGLQPLLDVHGRVFDDLNGNGKRESNERIRPGVRVWLDANGNRKYDKGERNSITDSFGIYMIHDYQIQNTLSVLLRLSNTQSLQTTSPTRTIRFEDWQESIAINFGVYEPSTINVLTFLDNDRNRKWNKGDRGLAGVIVFIDRDRDGVQDKNETALITDERGYASFTGLKPGVYVLVVRVPSAWRRTTLSTFLIDPLRQGSNIILQGGMRRV